MLGLLFNLFTNSALEYWKYKNAGFRRHEIADRLAAVDSLVTIAALIAFNLRNFAIAFGCLDEC